MCIYVYRPRCRCLSGNLAIRISAYLPTPTLYSYIHAREDGSFRHANWKLLFLILVILFEKQRSDEGIWGHPSLSRSQWRWQYGLRKVSQGLDGSCVRQYSDQSSVVNIPTTRHQSAIIRRNNSSINLISFTLQMDIQCKAWQCMYGGGCGCKRQRFTCISLYI